MTAGRLSPIEVAFQTLTYSDPVVRALEDELQQEYIERYGSGDITPMEPDDFATPLGLFLVGFVGNEPVVSGGFRRHDDESAEIKRMYTVHDYRGGGHARRLLGELERRARHAGYSRVVLETGTKQPEAIALYESSGYEPTEPFGVYLNEPASRFFAKKLLEDTVVDLGRHVS
jgi:GNAT superfamily N-acetyltransferase